MTWPEPELSDAVNQGVWSWTCVLRWTGSLRYLHLVRCGLFAQLSLRLELSRKAFNGMDKVVGFYSAISVLSASIQLPPSSGSVWRERFECDSHDFCDDSRSLKKKGSFICSYLVSIFLMEFSWAFHFLVHCYAIDMCCEESADADNSAMWFVTSLPASS